MTSAPDDSTRMTDQGPSLHGLAIAILRARRATVRGVLAFVGLGLLFAATRPVQYSAGTVFSPQGRRSANGGLASLASQYDVQLSSGELAQQPQFYADLAMSKSMFRSVVRDSVMWHAPDGVRRVSWMQLAGADEADSSRAVQAAAAAMAGRVSATVNPKTGVIRVTARHSSPELALALAQAVLVGVDRFNRDTRQSQASAERRFLERRAQEVMTELREAEDRLQQFLTRNRGFISSSETQFERDRLTRDIAMRQSIAAGLLQGFEQAKIEEVRDTPAITVVERPDLPLGPDPKPFVRFGVLGVAFGVLMGMLLAFVGLLRMRPASAADEEAALDRELSATKADLRSPLRLLRRAP